MKYKVEKRRDHFDPVEVTITCESAEELRVLRAKIKGSWPGEEYDRVPWANLVDFLDNMS